MPCARSRVSGSRSGSPTSSSARTDLLGRASVAAAPVVNWATGTPGSWPRRVMEKTVGLASRAAPAALRQAALHDLVQEAPGAGPPRRREPERSRCSRPASWSTWSPTSAGPSWRSTSTTASSAASPRGPSAVARRGCTRVTSTSSPRRPGATWPRWSPRCAPGVTSSWRSRPAPTSSSATTRSTPRVPDADLVAAHTFDPAEYLMRRHRDADDPFTLRDEFPGRDDGSVPDAVTYHVACHLQAQNTGPAQPRPAQGGRRHVHPRPALLGHRRHVGLPGRELRTGPQGGGPAGPGDRGGRRTTVVCGDCHLANGSILQETGTQPEHPLQLMARAYGLGSPEDGAPR